MGTWGEGLYDNDSALDDLGDLLALPDDEDDPGAADLVARIGLLAWLNPIGVAHDDGDAVKQRLAAQADLAGLPEATRAALAALLADPKAATRERSRKPEARYAIGSYCDGPRIDALLRFPGAQPTIDAFGEQMAERLDGALAGCVDLYDLAGSMAPLGVLIELAMAGLFQPAPARVARWRSDFAVLDKKTRSERGFWWKYVRRVQAGFDLLAPGTAPAPAKPIVRKPGAPREPAATGPLTRFHHPKFGVGVLLGRSGQGADERLDLRFEDGQVRKLLARFVTPLAD